MKYFLIGVYILGLALPLDYIRSKRSEKWRASDVLSVILMEVFSPIILLFILWTLIAVNLRRR